MFDQNEIKDILLKNKNEIIDITERFAKFELPKVLPEIVNRAAVLLAGSVVQGNHDQHSDIDLMVVFYKQIDKQNFKHQLITNLRAKNTYKPIELHGKHIFYLDELKESLSSWAEGWLLAELKSTVVLYDPANRIGPLKKAFEWYPQDIFIQKIESSFAELTFLIFDRYKIAAIRKNIFYAESVKVNVLSLIVSCTLIANGHYPSYDKRIFADLKKYNPTPKQIELIEKTINETNPDKVLEMLIALRALLEKELLDKNLIINESIEYWSKPWFPPKSK